MTIKYRQFQQNRTCLTSCQTTSGAPIVDLIVAFCTLVIFRKSHERTAPIAAQKCFTHSKTDLWNFVTPNSNTRVKIVKPSGLGLIWCTESQYVSLARIQLIRVTLINCLQLLSYNLTGSDATVVLYVDVSNDSSFRHVDHELSVAGLCHVNVDFEDGQHISRSRFTHDVVDSVNCLCVGVCHKIHRHMECRWYWDI